MNVRPRHLVLPSLLALATLLPACRSSTAGQGDAKGPIGWDVYRRLDELPLLPVGVASLQFSSFDRAGGNDDGFTGRYSCLRTENGRCVIAEAAGAGEIDSIWFTRGEIVDGQIIGPGDVTSTGKITIVLDGDVVLDASLQDVVDGKLGAPFVPPLVANAQQSSGGVTLRVPMPYRTSMLVLTDANPRYFHVSYRAFSDAVGVTRFDPADPAEDVVALLAAAGTRDPKPARPDARTISGAVDVAPGGKALLPDVEGPGLVTQIRVKLSSPPDAEVLSGVRLRVVIDGQVRVDSPLGEFFGSGLGESTVRALFFAMEPGGWYSCWWPMPFADRAKVMLVNGSTQALAGGTLELTYAPEARWKALLAPGGGAAYFTALSSRGETRAGRDWSMASLPGAGRLVGVSLTMRGGAATGRSYLEGDERVYVDGARTPSWHGTGTEDFFESGWYFVNGTYSSPFHGSSGHEVATASCPGECDSAYRLMISDGVPFQSSLRFGIEHGPANDVPASYGSTAFLYSVSSPVSHLTDAFYTGNADARAAHAYDDGPGAEEAALSSSYEGDDDDATVTAPVRSSTGPVSFRLRLDPDNLGVVLRRTSDQGRGGQRASVAIDGVDAGIWLEPLANGRQRWLDDGFRLPARLTHGKQSIVVTLTPDETVWTAARYSAECLVPSMIDATPPSAVEGLAVSPGASGGVQVTWLESEDDTGIAGYEVYGARSGQPEQLLATTLVPGFTQPEAGLRQGWSFRIRALDLVGHAGAFSPIVTGVSSGRLAFEGEWFLTSDGGGVTTGGGVGLEVQLEPAGSSWSDGAQLWIGADHAGTDVSVKLTVPQAGTYALSAVLTMGPEYGQVVPLVDSVQVGSPLDAYAASVQVPGATTFGTVALTAGQHVLTWRITGRNGAATGYDVGLDVVLLDLQ